MASVVRRGAELRKVVRQRRRMRRLLLAVMGANSALFAAIVVRDPNGLFIAALCAVALALLAQIASFVPRLELRALRNEITRSPLTRAQGKRWAYRGLLIGALAVVAALVVGAAIGAWFTALAVAAPIALMSAIWALVMLLSTRRAL